VKRVQQLILPVGLPIVMALGIFFSGPGIAMGDVHIGPVYFNDLMVILIFLVNGHQMRFTGIGDRSLMRALALVVSINLIIAPVLGYFAVSYISMPIGLAVGLAIMASVPTTLSSAAVIATNVGGNHLWALALTIFTVLIGSFTAPLAISAILSASVPISPWPILFDILLTVLVPTAIGVLARFTFLPRLPSWAALIPSVAVLLIVWVTMSQESEGARSIDPVLILGMIVVAVVGHQILLTLGFAAGRSMSTEHAMPVLFVSAQKTLPLALTILLILTEQFPGLAAVGAVATITCVLWHFWQVFFDSVISQRLALRHTARLLS